ncbi:MAG TPA: winged helix-turn-helix domain-containing protein, partial [Micromonosporaceae bacterium]
MRADGGPLRVQALGPVRAWRGRTELDLGPPRQRTVFGLLAANANRNVPVIQIIDAVWGGEPPATADNGVHTYVSGLRRVLEPGR